MENTKICDMQKHAKTYINMPFTNYLKRAIAYKPLRVANLIYTTAKLKR